jgi:hypothetical protein
MKRLAWLTLGGLGLALVASQALAEDPAAPPPCPIRQKVLEKLDKDGDGKLSDEERAAARDALQERWEAKRAELLAKYDANANGVLDPEERKKAYEEAPPEVQQRLRRLHHLKERLDKDGDGKLSEEERAAARKALRRHGRRHRRADASQPGTGAGGAP